MGKRIGTSLLGIPIWVITGLALFVLFSAIYDWVVQDRSMIRYSLILGSIGLILITTVILHFITLKSVARQASKQLGN